MAVSGILGRWNLAGLRMRVETPDEIYDGVETLLTVHLENRRTRLPAFLVDATLSGARAAFTLVEPGQSATAPLPILFHGRGRQPLPAARVSSPFPVNFFVRSFPLSDDREIVVFPAPRPCVGAVDGGTTRRGEVSSAGKGYEGEISRIGDYRGGEPLKLIHWKLSARQGALKVKELSSATGTPVVLEIERLPGADLEARLRCASYLVGALTRAGRAVGLRLGGRLILAAAGRAHKLRLLTELALHGRD